MNPGMGGDTGALRSRVEWPPEGAGLGGLLPRTEPARELLFPGINTAGIGGIVHPDSVKQ